MAKNVMLYGFVVCVMVLMNCAPAMRYGVKIDEESDSSGRRTMTQNAQQSQNVTSSTRTSTRPSTTSAGTRPQTATVQGSGQSSISASSGGEVIEGRASYYGDKFHGKKTANGETFNMYGLTCAHKTLPFNTWLEVENLSNGKKVIVRVNDRGPFVGNRILDLSYGAARELGMIGEGVITIRARIIKKP